MQLELKDGQELEFQFPSPCGEFGNAALSSSTRMITGLVGLFWKTSPVFGEFLLPRLKLTISIVL